MKVLGLLYGILLPLLSFRGTASSTSATAVPTLEESVPIHDKCWVFMHLQKSGGTTVKLILRDVFPGEFKVYDSPHWKRGSGFLQETGDRLSAGNRMKVVAGGYAEALRQSVAVEKKCRWFTLFRHPISRLISAYYYCKKSPSDRACGSSVVNANNVDIVTFAKHWGNYAMRQFALSLVSVDDVLQYIRTDAVSGTLPSFEKTPGWCLLKVYLDDQGRTSEKVENPGGAMYEMLQPVQDVLRDKYTVGILEEFNTTLSLFNAALEVPDVDWHEKYANEGIRNKDTRYFEEEAAALEEAWTNSEIKKYMRLDLILYEHAVDVFHQQARAYGLE